MIERETYKSWWTRFRQAELRMNHRQNKVLARRDFHPNKVLVKVWSLFSAILGVSHLRDVTIWEVNFPCHFVPFSTFSVAPVFLIFFFILFDANNPTLNSGWCSSHGFPKHQRFQWIKSPEISSERQNSISVARAVKWLRRSKELNKDMKLTLYSPETGYYIIYLLFCECEYLWYIVLHYEIPRYPSSSLFPSLPWIWQPIHPINPSVLNLFKLPWRQYVAWRDK